MHDALRGKSKDAAADNTAQGLASAKALVIDGNPTSRSILKGMLVDLGLKPDRIKQAGRYIEARNDLEVHAYDIVLCDYHFNDTSQTGADLLDELRKNQRLPFSTVFILVTAEATQAKVAEAAESALDSYLLKPHNLNNLSERLRIARHRKVVLADIFQALQDEDFDLAANLCHTRVTEKGQYWVYAARIGGELLLRLNRHEQAKALFEIIDATKAMPWARLGIARAQLDSGQPAPARRLLESLIVENPDYADAYDVMGRAQFQAGEVEQAYETFRRAVELTPSSLNRLQKMGMLAFQLGKTEEATRVLERASSLGSTSHLFDYQSQVLLAQIYFDQNHGQNLQKCVNLLMQAHEKAPRSARLRRMHEVLHVMSLMLQRQVAEVVRRVKNMQREFLMADYDLEAAGNMMSLLMRLRANELELPDSEIWIDRLARRFCTSKALTDILCLMVREHPPYEAQVREAYSAVVSMAEQALTQAKSGQAALAIETLLQTSATTGNAKLIDLADMVWQRYKDTATDPDMEARVQELRSKFGTRVKAAAPTPP
jgi:tetratricopeptide (TPR) repeat protein